MTQTISSSFSRDCADLFVRMRGLICSPIQPDRLVHYTDAAGALGILQNKEIWLSNARYLNDSSEMDLVSRIVCRVIEDRRRELDSDSDREKFWMVNAVLAQLESLCRDLLPEKNAYVACFCTNSDLLSQWRGYADLGGGYALTLQTAVMLDKAEEQYKQDDVYLVKVLYEHEEWERYLRDLLNQIISDIKRRSEQLGVTHTSRLIDQLVSGLIKEISFTAPFLKHVGFQEESEWRLVVAPSNAFEGFEFRASSIGIVPYLKTDITGATTEITIGPRKDQHLAERAFKMLNIHNRPSISFSEIPLR